MTKEEIWETMFESEFHNAKVETVDGRIITGYVGLYENEYDSEGDEPCIGINIQDVQLLKNHTVEPERVYSSLFFASGIKSIEILDKAAKED